MRIGLVGKYTQLSDAYMSVIEALNHAGAHHGGRVEVRWVDSERLTDEETERELEACDGILVPGGFGVRGIEGKIHAARFARERGVPYLGICLGMQIAVAEFARHVAGMDGANSTEFDPETPHPVIDLLPEQKEVRDMGGTMRLGADPVKLHDGTRAREIYDEAVIYERHRHRYEVNNHLRKRLEHAGLVFSGTSPDDRLVEVIELPDHPFFVASQYHPEFKSRPLRPQPLFREFVGSALERAARPRSRGGAGGAGRVARREPAPVSAAVRSAAPPERERLVADFVRLCEIESPSRSERAVADAVTAELRELGLEVEEDGSGADTGSDAGNLLARIDGPEGARTILLCAHLDTVPLAAPVNVVQEDGALRNGNEAILGADNKAAVATILGAARRLVADGSPVGVELLFTTCEERALDGAKAVDLGRLRSEYGFVFDHASPIGELVVASPTYYRLEARFLGHAAHAGIRPEAGRNAIAAAARAIAAMPIGRLDPETTANVGLIEGGTAANVVAERCVVELEARSLDEARAAEVVQSMVDAATEAAAYAECDVETEVERLFRGLPAAAHGAGGGGRGGRAPEPRARARLHLHRRRQRRQRVRRRRPARGERGQRHRAQPPARRERHGRGARADARRDARDRRGERRVEGAVTFERIGWRGRLGGQARHRPGRALPLRRRRGGGARDRRPPRRRGACSRVDGDALILVRQPREAVGERACSSCRPGSSTRARTRSRPPSASWPRRSARAPRGGSTSRASTPRPASPTRSATSTWPRTSTTRRRRPTRTSASRSWRCRSTGSTTRSSECRDSKTLIGLLWLRACLR